MTPVPPPDLRTEPLVAYHDRALFTCGVESLDNYLRMYAGQDVRRMANSVFVLADSREPAGILGYYTLCATAISQGEVPAAARKHVPRYPLVSATLLGRLAVAEAYQGRGFGKLLVVDAMRRAYASARAVGSSMLVVDAINEQAVAFYQANGFVRMSASLRLALPIVAIGKLA